MGQSNVKIATVLDKKLLDTSKYYKSSADKVQYHKMQGYVAVPLAGLNEKNQFGFEWNGTYWVDKWGHVLMLMPTKIAAERKAENREKTIALSYEQKKANKKLERELSGKKDDDDED